LPLRDALIKTLQATSLQPGTFTQYLVHELLEHIDYDAHLTKLRACYAERASLLSRRCSELGLSHRSARGGFFLWVRTMADATLTAKHLASQGLLAVPESAFRAPGLAGPDRHLRLAFPRYLDEERAKLTLRIAFARENIL
jgi:DNA-binding transcriptional MocR family regulator